MRDLNGAVDELQLYNYIKQWIVRWCVFYRYQETETEPETAVFFHESGRNRPLTGLSEP